MIRKIFLMPRQSGKTTIAKYEYLKTNSILVSHNHDLIKQIKRELFIIKGCKEDEKFLLSSSQIATNPDGLKGYPHNTLILDDYSYFDTNAKKALYNVEEDFENILIITTPRTIYPSTLFNLVKEYKDIKEDPNKVKIDRILEIYESILPFRLNKEQTEETRKMLIELAFDFITDKRFEIINDTTSLKHDVSHLEATLGWKDFRASYMNIYTK